ncbi:MAG: GIY-YIG nuclease family protein [Calditrichaceae bacterium]
MSEEISYQITFLLNKKSRIIIGKLGIFEFPAGKYIYTGSALKNMEKRLERHLKKNKKLHWHIDYILQTEACSILNIQKSIIDECMLNQKTPGKIIVPGFGSSDCRNGCISHLKFCES